MWILAGDFTHLLLSWLVCLGVLLIESEYHGLLARWIKWRACDVGEAKEGLENELWRRWSDWKLGEWALLILILQAFSHFTYVTAHSPTLLSPLLRHRIFTYFTWRAAHEPSVSTVIRCFVQFQRNTTFSYLFLAGTELRPVCRVWILRGSSAANSYFGFSLVQAFWC